MIAAISIKFQYKIDFISLASVGWSERFEARRTGVLYKEGEEEVDERMNDLHSLLPSLIPALRIHPEKFLTHEE